MRRMDASAKEILFSPEPEPVSKTEKPLQYPVQSHSLPSLCASSAAFNRTVERLALALATETGEGFFHALVDEIARLVPASQVVLAAFQHDFDLSCVKRIAWYGKAPLPETFPFDALLYNALKQQEQLELSWESSLDFRTLAAFSQGYEDHDVMIKAFHDLDGVLLGFILFRLNDDGSSRWILHSLLKIFSCRVASELKRTLNESESQLLAVAFETNDGVIITDPHRRILRVNEAFVKISGYQPKEVIGCPATIFYDDPKCVAERWDRVAKQGLWQGEVQQKCKNGDIQPHWESINSVYDAEGNISYYVINFEDISDRKAAQQRIQNLAYYDVLTGLPNRRLFTESIKGIFDVGFTDEQIGALLFIDLDHFKTINDSLGHATGDWVLKKVANRLKKLVRQGDLLARLGGDEFVLMLPSLSGNAVQAEQQAYQIGQRLIKEVSAPYQFENRTLHVGASVGISLFPDKNQTADDLLKQADTAMYQAKNGGRKMVVFFDQRMQRQADKRLHVYSELKAAIANNELVVYYQPQHLIDGKELMGVEALIRWQPEGRMMVSPAEFIPIAEETDLIIDIGYWVLHRACAEFVQMRESGLNIPQLAVNVSAKQFHYAGFIDQVMQVLDETAMDPTMLNLEITESVVLGNADDAISKMELLREIGISFAIDDFGAGYSSLAYLKRLPADELKIDRSFVQDIPRDIKNMTIVEAVLAMARHLGFNVTAEGVETPQQLQFLRQQKCNFYQGFLASKPVSAENLGHYLRRKEAQK